MRWATGVAKATEESCSRLQRRLASRHRLLRHGFMDDWRPGTLQMKRCPVEKAAMSVKALQAVPRAYFGAESTIHTMRARGVTVQQGEQVNQGVIRGMQGRRGEIPGTYTAVDNSMLQGAGNMVAPPVESLWAVQPPAGGGKPSSSAIRQGPRQAPPVGGGKTPRPPQPFPERGLRLEIAPSVHGRRF